MARSPYYKVTYNSVDITEDISKDVQSIVYTDAAQGEANEVIIVVDDLTGKWKNEWLVNTGVKISLEIGYSQNELLDCGDFEVDEIHYKGQPDTVEIKCLSIGESNSLREEDSHAFENQTVREIAQYIADKNGMTLFPTPEYTGDQLSLQWEKRVLDMKISRVTQDRESDIGFLNRITKKYGLSFVFGKEFFTQSNESNAFETKKHIYIYVDITLETVDPVHEAFYSSSSDEESINNSLEEGVEDENKNVRIKSYKLKNLSKNTISEVQLVYHDAFTNELYQYHVDYDSLPPAGKVNPLQQDMNSFLRKEKEYTEVENKQQAEIAAKAKLYAAISNQITGSMDMEGLPSMVSGTSLTVDGLGKLSGKYYVTKSKHKINRSKGYATSIEVKMLQPK